MKYMDKIGGKFFYLIAIVLSLHFLGHDAFAAETGPASGPGKTVGHLMESEIPTELNLNAYQSGLDLERSRIQVTV